MPVQVISSSVFTSVGPKVMSIIVTSSTARGPTLEMTLGPTTWARHVSNKWNARAIRTTLQAPFRLSASFNVPRSCLASAASLQAASRL